VISSEIWDWLAALTGLRSSEGLFLPSYWCVPAELTAPGGWVLSPNAVLWALLIPSVLGVLCFVWRRRSGYLHLSFAFWGALLADTPYVVLVPILIWGVWFSSLRLSHLFAKAMPDPMDLPWKRLFAIYFVAFAVAFACNLSRCGFSYVPGYAKNALAAIRWDGGWHPLDTAKMDELLDEYVTELAREAAGRRWIFTDGLCDSGIELASERVVRSATPTKTVSLAEGARDESYWRARGFVRQEELSALASGASGLLRSWALDRPSELTNAVFQCGFAFLEKEASSNGLETCGLVLRSGLSSDAASRRVNELAEKIVGFYRDGGKPEHGGRIRQARFCAMQWRVARAIRRQATELDRRVRTREALEATELAERLDELNPYARKQGATTTEAADLRAFGSLTPREGLAFSLSRANFTLARRFAIPILKDEPENPEANFAMAMSHLVLQEHAQARHYFQIALKKRPNDATLLNNIAVSSLMLGDIKDAEEKAKAALKAKPDSEAIKDTLRQVQSAKRK